MKRAKERHPLPGNLADEVARAFGADTWQALARLEAAESPKKDLFTLRIAQWYHEEYAPQKRYPIGVELNVGQRVEKCDRFSWRPQPTQLACKGTLSAKGKLKIDVAPCNADVERGVEAYDTYSYQQALSIDARRCASTDPNTGAPQYDGQYPLRLLVSELKDRVFNCDNGVDPDPYATCEEISSHPILSIFARSSILEGEDESGGGLEMLFSNQEGEFEYTHMFSWRTRSAKVSRAKQTASSSRHSCASTP